MNRQARGIFLSACREEREEGIGMHDGHDSTAPIDLHLSLSPTGGGPAGTRRRTASSCRQSRRPDGGTHQGGVGGREPEALALRCALFPQPCEFRGLTLRLPDRNADERREGSID
ncbi:hypothetical protein BHE74_00051077 [Ensete ventricosum]|nr:hypothetical protein BHE74_00051077 [Ensete ventricosum]